MREKEEALKGNITAQMLEVARSEGIDPEFIRDGVAKGSIVILGNPLHGGVKPLGIGEGLRTKVNANIGTSEKCSSVDFELKKLDAALKAKADTVMDLSTSGDFKEIRKAILSASSVPVGTVPIYEAAIRCGEIERMCEDFLFEVIEDHAKSGVDFMTVHCGVTFESIGRLKCDPRLMDVVSRGGAFLIRWILANKEENPLYKSFDILLDIARKYDVVLSLGDGMRPGCIADSTDRAQIQELLILGQLTERAWKAGVQVIIEGPGHVPFNEIEANVKLEKSVCKRAPFYVLGPLPTDVAMGYDHITSAIGGTLAGATGADFLCYVTPSEHLGLPDLEDIRKGVIATRIAAHAADIVKGVPGAAEWDKEMSRARKSLDWKKQIELALDPERAAEIHEKNKLANVCTMCGKYCSMKIMNESFKP